MAIASQKNIQPTVFTNQFKTTATIGNFPIIKRSTTTKKIGFHAQPERLRMIEKRVLG